MKEKNLYEFILEKLGVDEGEKFNIKPNTQWIVYNPYHFREGELIDNEGYFDRGYLIDLLTGKATIEKLPWKPKNGDMVWYVGNDGDVYMTHFSDDVIDLAMLKCEWYFRTEEEAESNKDKAMREMKEVIGND